MRLDDMFDIIKEYQDYMGYNKTVPPLTYAREMSLGLFMEVAEMVESFQWKPWRHESVQDIDRLNLIIEMVDIFFFLHGVADAFGITAQDLEHAFVTKIKENYARIERGYHGSARPEEPAEPTRAEEPLICLHFIIKESNGDDKS